MVDDASTPPSGQWAEFGEELSGDDAQRVYESLRRLARKKMRSQADGHTLQATALANEAWIRLSRQDPGALRDRPRYLRLAASAMRTILIDHARAKNAQKRGGGGRRVTLHRDPSALQADTDLLLDLDEALVRLLALDERLGRVAEMRIFLGLALDEIADSLHVSLPTVERAWRAAKTWLERELGSPE